MGPPSLFLYSFIQRPTVGGGHSPGCAALFNFSISINSMVPATCRRLSLHDRNSNLASHQLSICPGIIKCQQFDLVFV